VPLRQGLGGAYWQPPLGQNSVGRALSAMKPMATAAPTTAAPVIGHTYHGIPSSAG
jgi:hypothetical protein